MKKTPMTVLIAALLFGSSVTMTAQTTVDVDRTKYPDYSEKVNPDWSLMPATREPGAPARARAVTGRPDHVNNAETKHFPPVFNQHAGSCGSASRISYMFSYELAAYRNLDGSDPANHYPSHFVWLHTNSPGNQGKDAFVMHVGVPSAATYGGQTYSSLFGGQDCADNDFGWMQGYDKWYEAMHNRMLQPSNFPVNVGTEEGREAVKNWLWNHNGDNSFAAGGICGIGVASGGVWKDIPKTETNDAIGVTGMGYVHQWGTQVDHALTIVGYDDRIEFDLDKDGIYGEPEADELGAWIIVNSWGQWENGGFIYCPYAHGVPAFANDGTVPDNFWTPEIYKVRKDYRPLRTIKLKMDYSRRSEIALSAGVSADLNATEPEKTVSFVHFTYAGDGNYGNTNPAPEIPMLGRWADGKLHTEPMEFGYDLTDLTEGFDMNAPLKYFFIIDTKEWAQGKGTVYGASIMDYHYDQQGLETPFGVGEGIEIKNAGEKTIISVIVYGSNYHAPQNVVFDEGKLTWEAPQQSTMTVASYCIYHNGMLIGNVPATTYSFAPKSMTSGVYAVSALYADDNESSKVSVNTPVVLSSTNRGVKFSQAGFTIPGIFSNMYTQATIEYWIKPTSLVNWNQSGGPGWGTFMFHANGGGAFTAGWDTSNRLNTSASLKVGQWNHVAIVVDGNKMTVFLDGVNRGSVTSQTYSGVGGFGDLRFSSNGAQNAQNAVYDEIRIWNTARTESEIKACKNAEFAGNLMPKGLVAYLKGDLITDAEGQQLMYDCVGGHHATLQGTYTEVAENMPVLGTPIGEPTVSINIPENGVYAGVPVTLTATYNNTVSRLEWTSEAAGINNLAVANPTVTFPTAGTHTLTVVAASTDGRVATATCDILVEATPEIDASFTMTSDKVPAGERVTFHVANPMAGYLYHWDMPEADVETASTVTAATSYQAQGTYTVTLTVTAPDGSEKSHSETVEVQEVAPEAAFSITPAVVVKGEEVNLIDESRYAPTQWEWHITNGNANYIAYDRLKTLTIDKPGTYSVTLAATNNSGTSSLMRERAIIVANADSKNGLLFSNNTAAVKAARQPLAAGQTAFTIEWWMNSGWPEDNTNGIGDSEETMMLKTMSGGRMHLYIGGKHVYTADNFVVPGEWHHYAVTFASGKAKFYRDGVLKITRPVSATTALPEVKAFRIGGSEAPFTGSIDELRVWGTTLTDEQLRTYANAPIADVAKAEADDKLLLYYTFNQNGGDVQDATSNANHGVRSGFGPDGDAWALSKGVFGLNLDEDTGTDITADYLTNYAKPFSYDASKNINPYLSTRTFAIKDWKVENTITDMGITAGAHVDKGKDLCFTVTTGWDFFASRLTDNKAYQTITLPAGCYTFEAVYDEKYEGQCGNSYLVVAKGNTLPTTENLGEALAYTSMKDKNSAASNMVRFILAEETTVSLGLLVNMSGNLCMTIQQFTLKRSEVTVLAKSSDIVSSITLLNNDVLYYVSQPYHAGGLTSWAVPKGGTALKSNADLNALSSKDDTRQQFAILSNDNGTTHYLYHAAEKMFVGKDGALTDTPVDPVYFKDGAYDTTFVAYFDESHYINVGGSKELVINAYATPDGGNSCAIYPAGKFNPREALAKFPAVEVTALALSQSEATLEEGSSLKLTATIAPDYATEQKVSWSTSDADVAIVVKGVVVALSQGTATITAKAGNKEATCAVTVEKKRIPVASIVLDQTAVTVTEGDVLTLTATINPENADDKTVTWSTSDAAIATVDNGVVTALAPGVVTITAAVGGKEAKCVVTVEERFIPVTGIVLNYTEATIFVGDKLELVATVLPEDATKQTVTWKSSDKNVASVRRGIVVGAAEGTTVITAKIEDFEATCVVTVKLADGIDQVTDTERLTIYDITGRPVRWDAKTTDGLEQGIYIINGRKTVVK
ncbi:MAG: DUF5013 domain-containing protein [Bacteroidaceae bacterium]|nr:DUF5013 domain-containing protein [Bacteroidaceae bacterium]